MDNMQNIYGRNNTKLMNTLSAVEYEVIMDALEIVLSREGIDEIEGRDIDEELSNASESRVCDVMQGLGRVPMELYECMEYMQYNDSNGLYIEMFGELLTGEKSEKEAIHELMEILKNEYKEYGDSRDSRWIERLVRLEKEMG